MGRKLETARFAVVFHCRFLHCTLLFHCSCSCIAAVCLHCLGCLSFAGSGLGWFGEGSGGVMGQKLETTRFACCLHCSWLHCRCVCIAACFALLLFVHCSLCLHRGRWFRGGDGPDVETTRLQLCLHCSCCRIAVVCSLRVCVCIEVVFALLLF